MPEVLENALSLCKMELTLPSEVEDEQLSNAIKNMLPLRTFRVFSRILSAATYAQLQQIESRYEVINLVIRLLKKSKSRFPGL